MRIVFAVGFVEGFLEMMQGIGVKDILVSYYEAKKEINNGTIERISLAKPFMKTNARPSWKNRQYLGFRKIELIRRSEEDLLCE